MTNKPEVVAWEVSSSPQLYPQMQPGVQLKYPSWAEGDANLSVSPLIKLSDYENLRVECKKLLQALRRISYQASRHECQQTPASDLQRAFADLMRQADDALYCFYNDIQHKQRFCEYAGCCEPAVAESLCYVHLKDWHEQQTIAEEVRHEH